MVNQNLSELMEPYHIAITPDMEMKFNQYMALLLDWNQRINLTAITMEQEIKIKHFLDSLLVLDAVELPENAELLDVGTGAGFPGVPLRIVRNDIRLTLLDSLRKRLVFLEALCEQLSLDRVQYIHGRAEELGRHKQHRDLYSVVTARAVASLPILCEYCLPFVKTGGRFVAMKGPDLKDELQLAEGAIRKLGGMVQQVKSYDLPNDHGRTLVVIEKISQTPTQYPRLSAKISKAPL